MFGELMFPPPCMLKSTLDRWGLGLAPRKRKGAGLEGAYTDREQGGPSKRVHAHEHSAPCNWGFAMDIQRSHPFFILA